MSVKGVDMLGFFWLGHVVSTTVSIACVQARMNTPLLKIKTDGWMRCHAVLVGIRKMIAKPNSWSITGVDNIITPVSLWHRSGKWTRSRTHRRNFAGFYYVTLYGSGLNDENW